MNARLVAGLMWLAASVSFGQNIELDAVDGQAPRADITEVNAAEDKAVKTKPSVEQINFFESKIRPVLIKECYSCHSSKTGNAKGGLRLDTEQLTHLGGSSGPAIVPGDLEASLLYNAITYQDFAMPPKRPLPDAVVEDFRKWIEMGAPDPRQVEVGELNSQITAADIARAKQEFWAYQPPLSPALPVVAAEEWPRRELDRFVLSSLEEAQLTPAADAESHQVLRRLCYDLIGLPPSPEQATAFAQSWKKQPDRAIAELVDALLATPQFGERWGRHWLDLARYAESNGREVNATFPHAWRYRDYVIDAFNSDKPYDRFVLEQLAGDLLPVSDDQEWGQNLIATSFLALGSKTLTERNGAQFAADLADEQVDTTTRVMLATSVACARCHDHKFEPIPQSDYYAMAGIFASTVTYYGTPASQYGNLGGIQNRNRSNLIRLPFDDPNPFDRAYTADEVAKLNEQLRDSQKELAELRLATRGPNKNNQGTQELIRNLNRLQTQMTSVSTGLGGVDEQGKPISFCMGVQDRSVPRDLAILVRGEIDQPAQVVARDFPQVLRTTEAVIPAGSSGRLELAQWIASPENPLTARVMVNRIWQHLLGAGIVATTEDFGSTGQAPSHPALLDYLALKFIDSGWSIKAMVREIATSRTYRMSSAYEATKFEQDPDNKLLWRANPRRMNAEAIRDSILFVAGRLDLERPRASEVAKVGYMQVRDGNLINVAQLTMLAGDGDGRREIARQLLQQRTASAPLLAPMRDNAAATAGPGMRRMAAQNRQAARARGASSSNSQRVDMVQATFRSVYLPILRDELPRALEVFDFAEPSMVIGQRETSNTPNQALFMLNNDFVLLNAEALASRVLNDSDGAAGSRRLGRTTPAGAMNTAFNPAQQLERLFLMTYGRSPTQSEKQVVREFMQDFGADPRNAPRTTIPPALVAIAQSLMAAAEFRYID